MFYGLCYIPSLLSTLTSRIDRISNAGSVTPLRTTPYHLYRNVPPHTTPYNPVLLRTTPYHPVRTRTIPYHSAPPRITSNHPEQHRTTLYHHVPLRTTPYHPVPHRPKVYFHQKNVNKHWKP